MYVYAQQFWTDQKFDFVNNDFYTHKLLFHDCLIIISVTTESIYLEV